MGGFGVRYTALTHLFKYLNTGVKLNLILPLSIISFQIIALLIGIAIEAYLLRKQLNWTRQHSVQYATAANIIASVILWLLLFGFEGQLPQWLRLKIIRLILFSSSFESLDNLPIDPVIVIGFILTYVLVSFIKIKVLDILKVSSQPIEDLSNEEIIETTSTFILRTRLAFSQDDKDKTKTIFLGNFLSVMAILGLMLLQLLFN